MNANNVIVATLVLAAGTGLAAVVPIAPVGGEAVALVPEAQKKVDWSKAAVVCGKKADAGAAKNKKMSANQPKDGDALEVRLAWNIAHEGRRTIYTIKFSPQAVSPFRLDKGESMRFAVLANLNDGKTRYGALETAPGILVKGKWPYGFQELVLVETP